jgi:isopentenyl-diphosphate delta-isomerase
MKLRKTVEELDKKYHDRKVVLVDDDDKEIRIAGLIEAHRDPGLKHRAFSLQLYRMVDGKKELLLQQRAGSKPVFPHYWANTCCYNLAPGEGYMSSAVTRVREEIGVQIEEKILKELYKFTYYASDMEGWCENELDTVMVGEWDGQLSLNPEEAMDAKWVEWGELNRDIVKNLEEYAPWFKMILADPRFRSIFE